MEMRPGYKQTEVGVIPNDWDIRPLTEVSKVTSGKRLPLGYFVGDKETPYPYIRVTDMRPGRVDTSDIKYVPEAAYPSISKYRIFKDDLFISVAGTLGIVGRIPDELDGANLTENADRISAITCDKDYLLHVMLSPVVQDVIESEQTVGAQPKLALMRIRNFLIPLPPTEAEQRAIAAALSDVDALLDGLDRLIAKKRDLKQGAMQQLLTGQARLPGFHGEWEVKRLGDVGEISSAGVDKKLRQDEVPVRLVNYLDVYYKDFIYSYDLNHWVTARTHQIKRCAVKKGDVFFTPTSETRNDIGLSAVAMEDIPDAAYSYHVARLRLHEPWDLRFRTYAFKTRAFLDQAETLCDGNGTRYVVSQSKFRSMTVRVPPVPEQTAIAEVLSDIDAELSTLEARRDKTRNLKQAMMQELLTGKTRIVPQGAVHA